MQRILDERVTIAAVKVLIGNYEHYPAIKALIARTRLKQRVISSTIRLLLAKWLGSLGGNRTLENTGALSFALELLPLTPLSSRLVNRLVKAVAHAGFIGRFPELPQHMLKRNPDLEEITLLVSSYVNNKAVQSHSTEEKLEQLARVYLPREAANAQIERIESFRREWEAAID